MVVAAVVEKRLRSEGRYDHFRSRWKSLQGGGMLSRDAYRQALSEYDGLDGDKVMLPDGSVVLLSEAGKAVVPDLRLKKKQMAKARTDRGDRLNSDGSVDGRRGVSRRTFEDGDGNLRDASLQESIEWVASHLEVRGVKAKDAPSSQAWGMYIWAKSSDGNRSEFWRIIYPKLLPTRSSLSRGGGDSSSSGDVEKMIADVERAMGGDG